MPDWVLAAYLSVQLLSVSEAFIVESISPTSLLSRRRRWYIHNTLQSAVCSSLCLRADGGSSSVEVINDDVEDQECGGPWAVSVSPADWRDLLLASNLFLSVSHRRPPGDTWTPSGGFDLKLISPLVLIWIYSHLERKTMSENLQDHIQMSPNYKIRDIWRGFIKTSGL